MNQNTNQLLQRYRVFVHGFGTGNVWANSRAQAHYLVILHLRSLGETVAFTQPMNLTKIHGVTTSYRPCVYQWRVWEENEPQQIEGRFSLVGSM